MATKVKTKYLLTYEDDNFSGIFSKAEILKRVNAERLMFIQDKVDDELIAKDFPTEIRTISMAKKWLERMDYCLTEVDVTKKHSIQKTFLKMFDVNGSITGVLKDSSKCENLDFTIRVLNLDEYDLNATLQVVTNKANRTDTENLIATIFYVSLYDFGDLSIEDVILYLINRLFRDAEGVGRYLEIIGYTVAMG